MPGLLDDDPFRALGDALVGQVLPGSEGRFYPLRERIGEGGQGWVFRATWSGSVDVVVKVLRPDTANQDSLGRFQREAHVLRMLSQQPAPNPHVVRFFDHAYANVRSEATRQTWTVPFTVLEFVDGETLEKAIERAQPRGIGLERSRRILRHVVLALTDVHAQNVVHRDLKPSNILLAVPGGRELAKVTDFGLAKMLDPGLQRTTHLAGATAGYAPPEQFENGNRRVGRPTDVFSLAAVFYEMVTGVPAFPFDEHAHPLLALIRVLNDARPALARVRDRLPRELAERPDVIAAVDAQLLRALAPEPAERHATVTELHEGLERALGALAAPPSHVAMGPHGGLLVQRSDPLEATIDDSLASTQAVQVARPVDKTAPMLPKVPIPQPSSAELSREGAAAWLVITPAQAVEAWLGVVVAPTGDRAVGVGPRGVTRWKERAWTPVELPAEVDASRMRAVAWHESVMVFAGAWPIVAATAGGGNWETWRLDRKGLAFHGAYADERGILLTGERVTRTGTVGVVVEIAREAGGWLTPRLVPLPECGPLRGVTRLRDDILACGDGGALVIVPVEGEPRLAHACEPALNAVLALPDGTAVAVGCGGFVFRVWPTLQVELDAIQTTKDLSALARAADGSLFCGGASGRVLRRDSAGWVRVGEGQTVGSAGRIRALHAERGRLVAFGDDGQVAELVDK